MKLLCCRECHILGIGRNELISYSKLSLKRVKVLCTSSSCFDAQITMAIPLNLNELTKQYE